MTLSIIALGGLTAGGIGLIFGGIIPGANSVIVGLLVSFGAMGGILAGRLMYGCADDMNDTK